VTSNEVPQTNRRPLPLSDENRRRLLHLRRKADHTDEFVLDAEPKISDYGKIALRLGKGVIDYYFTLGDFCALKILGADNRLNIAYVRKAMLAYQRAFDVAEHDVDRSIARRAIEMLANWLVEAACEHPTRRNLAVALWATADDESNLLSAAMSHDSTSSLLDMYRTGVEGDDLATEPVTVFTPRDEHATRADHLEPDDVLSDATKTQSFLPDAADYTDSWDMPTHLQPQTETHLGDNDEVPFSDFTHIENKEIGSSLERTVQAQTKNNQNDFDVGDVIEDRYEVAEVRIGGMGVVYLCYDHNQRGPVAIKSFQRRFLDNEKAVARFEQEALTWIRLEKHPHIVQARLVQRIHERPHIILEHISGMEDMGADLRSWLDQNRMSLKQALEFSLHVALGMHYATQKVPGLVHRDLKPANIMITHEGIAKITDFGLVRSVDLDKLPDRSDESGETNSTESADYRLTRYNAVVGTPPYMSPEQVLARDVDIRSDIYAFGCVLYEMLTGKHPFRARGVKEWRSAHLEQIPQFSLTDKNKLPAQLAGLTLSCLSKAPEERPASWHEAVEQLSQIYEQQFGELPLLAEEGTAMEARELVNKGYSLTELRRYEEALEAYDEAIVLQTDYAWAWGRKGRTLRLLERYEEAIACYDKALAINANDGWSWNGKGIVLEKLGKWEEALAHFEQAARLDPTFVWHWYNISSAYTELERYDEALTMIRRALAIDSRHINSWGKLGQIQRRIGNYQDAISAYRKAIELWPEYAWAYNGCGLALKAIGDLEEAIVCFKIATKHQPDGIWHWYNLTEALVDMKQYHEAIQPAQEAVRVNPKHVQSWGKLGQVMRYMRRYEEAIEAYERALEMQPDFDWAINGKGLALEQLKRYEEALEAYQHATELNPTREWYWYNQGNVLRLMGRLDEALGILHQAVAVQPKYPRSWALISNILRAQNKLDEALQAAENALDVERSYARAWDEKGATLELMKRYDDALDAYQQAAHYAPAHSPEKLTYLYKQADVLVMLNHLDGALSLLEQALHISNRTAFIWAKHGQVLRKRAQLHQALESYTRAIEIDPEYAWAWNGRGLTLSLLARHDDALVCFHKAVELDPSDVLYWHNYAEELLWHDKYEDALEALDEAININPQHAESWSKCGQALRSLGRYEEALRAYDLAIQHQADFAWAWNGRGLTLRSLGNMEAALQSYQKAIEYDSNTIWYYINLMSTLLAMGRQEQALAVIEQALEVKPENAAAWARHGQILRRMQQFEQALESYNRALALDQSYAWAWNGKAMCLSELGYIEEAAECGAKAIQYDERDVWFWYNYGDNLYKLRRLQEAKNSFEQALKIDPDHRPSKEKLEQINKELGEE